MFFPEAFRRLMNKKASPNIGEEFASPIILIVEAVIMEVRKHEFAGFFLLGQN
jgi:hypothetical protein